MAFVKFKHLNVSLNSRKKGKILKKYLLFLIALITFSSANSLGNLAKEFESYFAGLENAAEGAIQNPFFYDELGSKLHLQAIFEGRAKINDKWYQANQSIEDATIVEISAKQGFVLFEKAQHHFYLNLKRANHKVFIH